MKIKPYRKHIIILAIFVAALIVLTILKGNSYISEYVFTRGISRVYIKGVGAVTSLFPFSLYEILIIAAAVYIIAVTVKTIKGIKKRDFQKVLKRLITFTSVVLCVVILYNVTASFAYSREPLDLSLSNEKPEKETVLAAAQYFLDDYNGIAERFERDSEGNIIPPYSFNELAEKLRSEYGKYADSDYTGEVMRAKPMIFSEIMSYLGFSGVFMAITAEPNVNKNIPPKSLPSVCAHEMAHSGGIMNENEANLLSYYILLNSDDDYLRYSGYGATFSQIMSAVMFTCEQEEYNQLRDSISPLIKKENSNASEYWKKYNSVLQDITNFINDLYLKINGVKEGTGSYENPYEIIDTGEKNEETGEPILEIHYSKVQYLYFTLYDKKGIK